MILGYLNYPPNFNQLVARDEWPIAPISDIGCARR